MSSKYRVIQRSNPDLKIPGLLTEREKEAHASHPQLRGLYDYEEEKKPEPPADAKKIDKVKKADADKK